MTAPDGPTALYRFYDANDVLLYVGITYQPPVRFAQHSGDKAWFPDIERIAIEWFQARSEAARAEAKAIRVEGPEVEQGTPR